MARQKDEEDRGFTVIDRRGSGSAEAPPAGGVETPPPSPGAPPPPAREATSAAPGSGPARDAAELAPAVDFTGFVLSLASSALYHMGYVGDPQHDEPAPAPDLPLARQTIDTLEMLQHKTRGNLDAEEDHLLEGVLYELHLRFVEASK